MELTKTEALVLQQLSISPGSETYGLQMVKDSNGALKMGSVYVILSRLVEKGFVESHREALENDSPRSVPRRLYKITALGNRNLHAYNAALAAYKRGLTGDLSHA